MLKRVMLFLITNLATVFVLGIVLNLLGVGRILDDMRHDNPLVIKGCHA
ncbi:MAG: hypothetical protein ACYDG4_04550 [Desulfuromonadaceae bacterium]